MSTLWVYLSVSVLMLTGVLLIFIILLQRGRGGGLAGAFGGAGGQSALGTKAGDVFTKITVGLAVIWVFLACMSIYALRYQSNAWASALPDSAQGAQGEVSPEPGSAPGVGQDDGGKESESSGADSTANGEAASAQPTDAGSGSDDAGSATETPAAGAAATSEPPAGDKAP